MMILSGTQMRLLWVVVHESTVVRRVCHRGVTGQATAFVLYGGIQIKLELPLLLRDVGEEGLFAHVEHARGRCQHRRMWHEEASRW